MAITETVGASSALRIGVQVAPASIERQTPLPPA
jgi:hypothetical protein